MSSGISNFNSAISNTDNNDYNEQYLSLSDSVDSSVNLTEVNVNSLANKHIVDVEKC
jgi:hypothetical protein